MRTHRNKKKPRDEEDSPSKNPKRVKREDDCPTKNPGRVKRECDLPTKTVKRGVHPEHRPACGHACESRLAKDNGYKRMPSSAAPAPPVHGGQLLHPRCHVAPAPPAPLNPQGSATRRCSRYQNPKRVHPEPRPGRKICGFWLSKDKGYKRTSCVADSGEPAVKPSVKGGSV
ncbi:hypothetical protein FN846DRAFT_1021145 [Sphaerosporella brunnea]|uniref:Uncharacterized protein n=1 Tax=Sphaerosporella brunnea TaxID=1250544 RepID=A0A5J5EYX5_9PEZI|nr:hypothetical protein FN846DRAFT_1021145 [Sphaerosporella brunnea]